MRLWTKWTLLRWTMSKPLAVLISDVHYNITTLPLADAAMRMAIAKANELGAPLIVAGDLHDTKANLRAECVNAMIETFKTLGVNCYVLRGNHDSINEKSTTHALNFLPDTVTLADKDMIFAHDCNVWIVPYQHDVNDMYQKLKEIQDMQGSTIIMHQGVHGSLSGEYIQDKTAIPKEWLKDFRVISGHYHTRQDIKCGRPQKGAVGLFSYIGNPYTLNYAEANDPPKGFQILMDDGTLEFIPTNLRRHIVLNVDKIQITGKVPVEDIRDIDLVKVKYTGTKEELSKINKQTLGKELGLPDSYKLELIPLDTKSTQENVPHRSTNESLDTIIDTMPNTTDSQKERLKTLWRNLCE